VPGEGLNEIFTLVTDTPAHHLWPFFRKQGNCAGEAVRAAPALTPFNMISCCQSRTELLSVSQCQHRPGCCRFRRPRCQDAAMSDAAMSGRSHADAIIVSPAAPRSSTSLEYAAHRESHAVLNPARWSAIIPQAWF
jgi:hypothetical protein